ncbi:MAG: lipoate--protein ligase family protein [Microthrixaceae bacterium]|nr:lipoate--protein ligase family protein [Microthrixaceae bacterium]
MSSDAVLWNLERESGGAAYLHELSSSFDQRVVRVNQVTSSAAVLSSTQNSSILDHAVVAGADIDVVKRHSGGGMVRLDPGAQLWIDIFLPRTDPLWVDDVSRSGDWLGAAWVRALDALGVDDLALWTDRLSDPELGRIVCFAATGPGEVTSGGRKLVGVSQRRSRAGARYQCTVYLSHDPTSTLGLLDDIVVGQDQMDRLRSALGAGMATLEEIAGSLVTRFNGGVIDQVIGAFVGELP